MPLFEKSVRVGSRPTVRQRKAKNVGSGRFGNARGRSITSTRDSLPSIFFFRENKSTSNYLFGEVKRTLLDPEWPRGATEGKMWEPITTPQETKTWKKCNLWEPHTHCVFSKAKINIFWIILLWRGLRSESKVIRHNCYCTIFQF